MTVSAQETWMVCVFLFFAGDGCELMRNQQHHRGNSHLSNCFIFKAFNQEKRTAVQMQLKGGH